LVVPLRVLEPLPVVEPVETLPAGGLDKLGRVGLPVAALTIKRTSRRVLSTVSAALGVAPSLATRS
jgi:hypothetical protein